MKKRILAVLLALALLCCFAPFAAAEGESYCYIHLEDHLMNMNYGDMDTRTRIAVGDEIAVAYRDTVPAQIYVDGGMVHEIDPDEDFDYFSVPVTKTGTIDFAVKQGDKTLIARTFTVISSEDMYKEHLRDAFRPQISFKDLFLSPDEVEDAVNHGFPLFNPFLPFAYLAMLTVNFFLTVFSFTRIVR